MEALSGDAQVDVRVIPGISSASYLAARLARPWQDWRFASAHGVACDIVAEAERAGELFLATSGGEDRINIRASAVTGYGEDLIKAAMKADFGIVETVAHFKAALHFNPKADFIIDIGGQDIKCFKVKNHAIDSIMLNEEIGRAHV